MEPNYENSAFYGLSRLCLQAGSGYLLAASEASAARATQPPAAAARAAP